jgi:geranylgeranyl diphosphate synthase, type I
MIHLFEKYKQPIITQIEEAFSARKKHFASINPWGEDTATKLGDFATQGKVIRGGLVLFSLEMFDTKISNDALLSAAAIEIIHSSLLVHDDIMDHDELRRGKPSIYKQFQSQATSLGKEHAEHIGVSLAICAGDLGYFVAWELLNGIQHTNQRKINQKISREISLVGIAQMQDVTTYDGKSMNEQQILHMYQYKTGRYSFSLPLAVGGLLADQSEEVINKLERLGEIVGILFQIADDNLGLYGSPEQTGKLIGSDIKENKQTLYRALLYSQASPEDLHKLARLFGNQNITSTNIVYVRSLVQKYKIDTYIEDLCTTYTKESEEIIQTLPIKDDFKKTLLDLVTFIITRNK